MSRQLAWELADQLRRHLSAHERTAVFVDLGGGEDVAAIQRLIEIAAKHEHPLPARMSEQLRLWAHAHQVQDHYAPALTRIDSARAAELASPIHASNPASDADHQHSRR